MAIDSKELHPAGDHLVRALAKDGQVRLTAICSTNTVATAQKRHGLSPSATVALGRFMTGLQLLSLDLKNPGDQITGQIRCSGPLGGITAVVQSDTTVRGYVDNPQSPTFFRSKDKFDIAQAVGNGSLTVIRQQAGAKPYTGSVDLISGEIAEDLTYYLAVSEQIPSAIGLGVLLDENGVRCAGGYLIQPMPDATEETLSYLEKRTAGFPNVTYLLEEGFSPAQILDLFAGDPDIEYLSVQPTGFQCNCNRNRMEQALLTLGREDLQELAAEGKGIELHCEFCGEDYHFTSEEILSLGNS